MRYILAVIKKGKVKYEQNKWCVLAESHTVLCFDMKSIYHGIIKEIWANKKSKKENEYFWKLKPTVNFMQRSH